MGDHLVHAYNSLDLEEVWLVVERDIPKLIEKLDP
jgi:uncharacterized protein with HEPN domain